MLKRHIDLFKLVWNNDRKKLPHVVIMELKLLLLCVIAIPLGLGCGCVSWVFEQIGDLILSAGEKVMALLDRHAAQEDAFVNSLTPDAPEE